MESSSVWARYYKIFIRLDSLLWIPTSDWTRYYGFLQQTGLVIMESYIRLDSLLWNPTSDWTRYYDSCVDEERSKLRELM
ncbi:hypothetical protein DPMN_005297 [Dreissena polymorpha]|uniref:Uncharacterized protein n=1 Tax=Dreissena polymorpha TaxID=45954 RepID=A0A9D4RWP6_DREPO|nr:hypothetical protein DPMN_005297 [Dreissena polymorpha]